MSGVTGKDLKKRIEAIMTHRVTLNLTFGKKLLLAAAGMAAVALPIMIGILDLPIGRAQSQARKPIAAEVVSVKRNTSEDVRSMGMSRGEPGGKLTIRGVPLYIIIARAYQVGFQSPRLSGGPEWIRSERYDIEAVAEKDAIPAGLSAAERDARFGLLLQGILADRFKLKMRTEDKEAPVYVLVVGKNGPKLQESKFAEKDCAGPDNKEGAPCHTFQGGRGRGLHAKAVTIQETAEAAENWSDRPIINKTGIQGLFEIDTAGWLPFAARPPAEPLPPGATPSAEALADSDPSTPTLFQIFDRLGLRLEPQRAPVGMFVIDHVERPTEN
jgi:bla regulator protein BlaR1